jgi:hypothetical protein
MKNSLRILQNASETEKESSIRTWPIFYVTITHMLRRVLGARFWGSGVKKWWCNTRTSHQQRKRHQSRFHLSQTPSSHFVKCCCSQAPNKRTQLRRIPQNLARERLSLFRRTWRSSCIVPLSQQSQPLHPSSTSPPVMELPLGKDQTS